MPREQGLMALCYVALNQYEYMAFIIGKKIKMDSTWDEDGKVIPVTKVQAGPVVVTQVRTNEKDGYEAFCVGFDNSAKNLS